MHFMLSRGNCNGLEGIIGFENLGLVSVNESPPSLIIRIREQQDRILRGIRLKQDIVDPFSQVRTVRSACFSGMRIPGSLFSTTVR